MGDSPKHSARREKNVRLDMYLDLDRAQMLQDLCTDVATERGWPDQPEWPPERCRSEAVRRAIEGAWERRVARNR